MYYCVYRLLYLSRSNPLLQFPHQLSVSLCGVHDDSNGNVRKVSGSSPCIGRLSFSTLCTGEYLTSTTLRISAECVQELYIYIYIYIYILYIYIYIVFLGKSAILPILAVALSVFRCVLVYVCYFRDHMTYLGKNEKTVQMSFKDFDICHRMASL